MTTISVLLAGIAAALAGVWQAWVRLLRPRLVLRYVRKRFGASAAWVVRVTGQHRRL